MTVRAARIAPWLPVLFAMLLAMPATAQEGPLVLEAGRPEIPLAGALEVLEDPNRRLLATDFFSATPPGPFHALPGERHSYGYSGSAFWARAEVVNPGADHADWLLVYRQVAIDHIRVYFAPAAGGLRELAPYGAETAGELFGGLRYPSFQVPLAPGERATILVRIENLSPIRFPLAMQDPRDFFRQDRVGRMWVGLALMVPLAVAVYMLFLWGAIRDRSLLLFIGFQLSGVAASAWISGYLAEILPMLPRRAHADIGVIAFNLICLFGLLHARAFLQLPRRQPRMARALFAAAPLFLLVIGLEFVLPAAARALTIGGVVGVVLFVFGIGLAAWRRRLPHAALYALAWASMLPSVASIIASRLNWIGHGAVSVTLLAASALSSLVFGIALAGQIRRREAHTQTALAQSRLLAAAHHDLRQPLQSLGIFIELMRGEADRPAQVRALAGRMEAAYASLTDFIDGLLELSRMGDGQIEPKRARLRTNDLLAPLVEEYRRMAAAVGLELRYVPSAAWIESDPRLLERIVRNLLANAVRHTQRGRILVGCRRCGDRLAIEIWDTGPGFDELGREKLFEAFAQGAEAQNSRTGFGLGLAIVRQLALRMGHEISLRSIEGKGSCFRVLVPRPADETPR
jgi:signal transduction histidine kinase